MRAVSKKQSKRLRELAKLKSYLLENRAFWHCEICHFWGDGYNETAITVTRLDLAHIKGRRYQEDSARNVLIVCSVTTTLSTAMVCPSVMRRP